MTIMKTKKKILAITGMTLLLLLGTLGSIPSQAFYDGFDKIKEAYIISNVYPVEKCTSLTQCFPAYSYNNGNAGNEGCCRLYCSPTGYEKGE